MQMITEVGAEQNTMTIVMMPSEFVSLARSLTDLAAQGRRQELNGRRGQPAAGVERRAQVTADERQIWRR